MHVDQYFPPVAGALCCIKKLKHRIEYPIECTKLIDHPLLSSQSVRELKAKYEELQVCRAL